jgi:hypothetical protein
LKAALSRNAFGDQESVPFASVREGDTINIVVPLTMVRGDMLAELILLLAAKTPTAILRQGNIGWVEPTWTAESSRHLMGLVSATQGAPESFASSSSPVDLARLAVWITACNSALSRPGGVGSAQGSVVPTSVGGAKSASKYLDRVFGGLRAISGEPTHLAAIATLERLLKLWIKSQSDKAIDLVRKNKISWGTVLMAGSPTETKKVKGNLITQIKSPSKPSRSPFLSGREKQELSSLFAPAWNTPQQLRENWNMLSAWEQHDQYKDFIRMLKDHYEEINKISTSVHAKLGHRKKWIHAACSNQAAEPTKKKDKTNEFVWAQNFYKLNLQRINVPVALVFSPAHYLPSKYDGQTILDTLWDEDTLITANIVTEEICGVTVGLWKEWADRFQPDFSLQQDDLPMATGLADDNPFLPISGDANAS